MASQRSDKMQLKEDFNDPGTRLPPPGKQNLDVESANSPSSERPLLSVTNQLTRALRRKKSEFPYPQEVLKRIDYVLIHPLKYLDEDSKDMSKRKGSDKKLELRKKFEAALRDERVEMQKDVIGDNVFVKLHVPFRRLCKEAEVMKLQMPLLGCAIYPERQLNFIEKLENDYLQTDDETDFVSAPFQRDKLHIYDGHDNPDTFFRPSLRGLLIHHILINMDIRNRDSTTEDDPMAKKVVSNNMSKVWRDLVKESRSGSMCKIGLPYLQHKKVYTDSFTLHDESANDPIEQEELEAAKEGRTDASIVDLQQNFEDEKKQLTTPDTRKNLQETWTRFFKYQPMWKIRDYFGEKIGLYYAWSGMLISTLWIPTLFGFAIFLYGLYLSVTTHTGADNVMANSTNSTNSSKDLIDQAKEVVTESIDIIKESFDNDVTPFFALIICLWGTVFLEMWKRKNATLAYEWDVEGFEDTEPDRPQFFGTKQKPDPVTLEETWYYPVTRYALKFLVSCSILIFMVCLVFISTASVIVYRVIMSIDYCATMSSIECLLVTTVASSILNALSIMILGKLYEKMAFKLTDWENHRTQTQYNDALIIKMFAFQFANSYTSLFYIAFFRGREKELGLNGFFGLGENYTDSCGKDNNCMSMLSFQVLVLMLMKPLPKFIADIILPWLKQLWRKRQKLRICCHNNVTPTKRDLNDYLERERLKPDAGDVTYDEYMEKVLQYGYLMLFAASFPLAPLIALLTNFIDKKVDATRLLWWYRRPVALIAQDIGMWYGILEFINCVGVVSNGFLIGFTCTWGDTISGGDLAKKLWIVLIFEHVVFAVKFLIAWFIPDVPSNVALASQREKYQVARILELAGTFPDSPTIPPGSKSSNPGVVGGMPISPVMQYRQFQQFNKSTPKLLITDHDEEVARRSLTYEDQSEEQRSNNASGGIVSNDLSNGGMVPLAPINEDGASSARRRSKRKKNKKRKSVDAGDPTDGAGSYRMDEDGDPSSTTVTPLKPTSSVSGGDGSSPQPLQRSPAKPSMYVSEEQSPSPARSLTYGKDGSTVIGSPEEHDESYSLEPLRTAPLEDKTKLMGMPYIPDVPVATPQSVQHHLDESPA